jgi:hypothetical protein
MDKISTLRAEDERIPKNFSQWEISYYKTSGKTKNRMGGRHLEGQITDPRKTRMEETNRKRRRMEAPSEGCQDPEGAVAP